MDKCKEGGFSPGYASRFALYRFIRQDERLVLISSRFISATIEEVYQAMRNNPGMPSKDRFVQHLNARLRLKLSVQLA